MSTGTSYRLGEVAGYEGDPRHEIPPLIYREDLEPGELARLMVEFPDETAPLWTEIKDVLGPGWYLGRTQSGDEVEFGAEHVFGINGPRFQMGAWYDFLPGARRAPRKPGPPPVPPPPTPEARGAPWYEFLPSGPRAGAKGPSIFDVWKRGAPAEPVRPGEKESFWSFFRKKPKVDITPIPTGERRESRRSFLRLPFGAPEPPAPPVSEEVQAPQEPTQAPPQAIIVPAAPRGVIMRPEGPSRPPDELFQVLVPEAPGAPSATPAPGAMIVGPTAAALPAQFNAFSVLEPGPAQAFGPPAQVEAPSPFAMFQPSEAAPTPFDVLEPQAAAPEQGLVVRPEQGVTSSSAFDILEPEPQALAPYVAPAPAPGPTVFDAIEPEPAKPKAVRKKAAKRKEPELPVWQIPSREEWIKWIQKTFRVGELWEYIRKERASEYFIEGMLNEEEGTGEPAYIPVETWSDVWEFDNIFPFFGIPGAVWQPYVDAMATEEEKEGYPDVAWEDVQEQLLVPLEIALERAFKAIQPNYLPGHFILGFDDGSGTWGLVYYEKMDPKEAAKLKKQAAREREISEREEREFERKLKSEIKRIWGAMPRPEDLIPWIEEKFDIEAMFQDIQKARRQKSWKQDLKEYDEAVMTLEQVADLGPNKSKDYEYEIAAYFGIPPDLITLYEEAPSRQDLWNDIFWPFFGSLSEAFTMLLPYANLPGMITVDEDETDHLVIQYVEQEEEE